jgi:hypothetical protein
MMWGAVEFHSSIANRAADRYFSAANKPADRCSADALRARYVRSFFDAYVRPESNIQGPDTPELRAMQAAMRSGAEYRRRPNDNFDVTMAAFGYTPFNGEGTWETGFEISAFSPLEAQQLERWWLEGLTKDIIKIGDSAGVVKRKQKLKVSGYVSGSGAYGHLGTYKRKLIATKIESLE